MLDVWWRFGGKENMEDVAFVDHGAQFIYHDKKEKKSKDTKFSQLLISLSIMTIKKNPKDTKFSQSLMQNVCDFYSIKMHVVLIKIQHKIFTIVVEYCDFYIIKVNVVLTKIQRHQIFTIVDVECCDFYVIKMNVVLIKIYNLNKL